MNRMRTPMPHPTTPPARLRPRPRPHSRLHSRPSLRLLALVVSASLLAGCATSRDDPGASVTLPGQWQENATPPSPQAQPVSADWWQRFGSSELEALLLQALEHSPDLAMARERVLQAELAVRSTGASLFPALHLNAGTQGREASNAAAASDSSSLGVAMSYEIDLWNSNRLSLQGAQAQLAASRFDFEGARLSLMAGVVNAYAQALAQQARIDIARKNLAIAERLFGIVEARHRNGAVSALDVSRQRAAVLTARDALLPMEVQLRQTLRALAILTGQVPQGFGIEGGDLYALTIPEVVPSVPGELLARRPDLASAEARLTAAEANIALARAALFPLRLSLGLSSSASSGEFAFIGLGSPVNVASVSLSLMQAIFDGGRLRAQVDSSESSRRQLVESYRSSLLTALKEVDDALASVARSRQQESAQREIRDEYEQALRLSELRYREGSDSLSTLLDAQRNLFSAEDSLLQHRLTRITATVDLYKALGGGWQADTPADTLPGTLPSSSPSAE